MPIPWMGISWMILRHHEVTTPIPTMRILFILTSHDGLGDTGEPTGFWLEEFAAPYFVLNDAGASLTLASPKGGQPPMDPQSDTAEARTEACERFRNDPAAQAALAATSPLSAVDPDDFDAVFYPGGHGPLWDLVSDPHSLTLIKAMATAGKPVAAVCHGPAVLLEARDPSGEPLLRGRRVTGFSNEEEAAVGRDKVVPLSLEDELIRRGGTYSKQDLWQPHVVRDGTLITGQNPASSEAVARALLECLS